MNLRRVALVATIAGIFLASSSCGGNNGDKSGASSTSTSARAAATPEVIGVVDAWAQAATPDAVCALMTYGFKLGAGQEKDPAQCASWIATALGAPKALKATIVSATEVQGQTAVRVTFSDGSPQTLYLLRECGKLKVNSLGELHPNPPAPPSC